MSFYCEVITSDREIYITADRTRITDNGDLVLESYTKDASEIIPVAVFAAGVWLEYYAASMIDGYEIAVDGVFSRNKSKNAPNPNHPERAKMTQRLRFSVLERDGYRCKYCGASARDGANLEIDHIIPVSRGGETKLENLQTLCRECNRSKAAKIVKMQKKAKQDEHHD